MAEKQFQTNMLVSVVSDDFIVIGSWVQIVRAAKEKAHLPIFSLGLGTKSCFERNDLRALKISEKFYRITKYVGY